MCHNKEPNSCEGFWHQQGESSDRRAGGRGRAGVHQQGARSDLKREEYYAEYGHDWGHHHALRSYR